MTDVYLDALKAIKKINKEFQSFEESHVDKHDYIKLILKELSSLPENFWFSLHLDTQNWYNEQVSLIQKGLSLSECPGFIDKKPEPLVISLVVEDPIPAMKEKKVPKEKIAKPEKAPLGGKKKSGISSSQSTPEQLQDIRSFILESAETKEEIVSYIKSKKYKINPFVVHRMFTEGMAFKKLIKKG